MKTYLIQAPRYMDGIPEGYILQVVSNNSAGPQASDIRQALIRAGFSGMALSWASEGNWKIIKKI